MRRTTTILLALVLAACGQQSDEPVAPAAETAGSIYAAAVENEARPAADRERDAGRKPAEVLEFFGIEPGMAVLDLFSGGGYYTELLSYVVGETGHVIAHSNKAYLDFVGDEFEIRHGDGHLPITKVLMAENNELNVTPDSLDAVMLVLTFHDFYYADDESGWPAIDVDALLAELHRGLRAGGVMAIVDHYAAAGSPTTTGGSTHRIDPAIVIAAMTSAGFVLEAESDMLRNPDDDYEKSVFDPTVRGKTDRFVMRFRKPE